MQRRTGTTGRAVSGEGAPEEEERPPYLQNRIPRPDKKKRPKRPEPLGVDAKNWSDDIPDPDGEVSIPE